MSALNLSTGIFTATESLTGLGLTIGSFVAIAFNIHSFTNGILPMEINPTIGYYAYVIDDTTFQLSTTSGSSGLVASYPSSSNTKIDVTKFHFEILSGTFQINFSENVTEITVKLSCQRDRGGWSYISLVGTSDEGNFSDWINTGADGRSTMTLYQEMCWKYVPELSTLFGDIPFAQTTIWGNNTNGTWSQAAIASTVNHNIWKSLTNFKVQGIVSNFGIVNNSVVEIYGR
jgi:hypothetical protein